MAKHRRRVRREDETGRQKQNSNLSNFDLNTIASIINSINLNQIIQSVNSMGAAAEAFVGNDTNENSEETMKEPNARRNQIIKSIKTLLTADKSEILQVVIQLYVASKNQNK